MKTKFKKEILISEFEREPSNPFDYDKLMGVIGVLNLAVAVFNGNRLRKSEDWKEHLRGYIKQYSHLGWDCFEYGFSGDHFWLHDDIGTKGERVVVIYLQPVIIEC